MASKALAITGGSALVAALAGLGIVLASSCGGIPDLNKSCKLDRLCSEADNGCPKIPSGRAEFIAEVATCSFATDDPAGCQAQPIPGCERPRTIILFDAEHPEDGVGCYADVRLEVVANRQGGVDIEWSAQEYNPVTCREVGELITGVDAIDGPCCQTTIDIPLPENGFSFRTVIQSGWR